MARACLERIGGLNSAADTLLDHLNNKPAGRDKKHDVALWSTRVGDLVEDLRVRYTELQKAYHDLALYVLENEHIDPQLDRIEDIPEIGALLKEFTEEKTPKPEIELNKEDITYKFYGQERTGRKYGFSITESEYRMVEPSFWLVGEYESEAGITDTMKIPLDHNRTADIVSNTVTRTDEAVKLDVTVNLSQSTKYKSLRLEVRYGCTPLDRKAVTSLDLLDPNAEPKRRIVG